MAACAGSSPRRKKAGTSFLFSFPLALPMVTTSVSNCHSGTSSGGWEQYVVGVDGVDRVVLAVRQRPADRAAHERERRERDGARYPAAGWAPEEARYPLHGTCHLSGDAPADSPVGVLCPNLAAIDALSVSASARTGARGADRNVQPTARNKKKFESRRVSLLFGYESIRRRGNVAHSRRRIDTRTARTRRACTRDVTRTRELASTADHHRRRGRARRAGTEEKEAPLFRGARQISAREDRVNARSREIDPARSLRSG